MLQIKDIKKQYITGELVQTALDGVSLTLRDCEFVAILGPSGSGKTTMLNVIGGLDRYDSGDLVINGISTKKYSDRDWDSYRNHRVGFVFQAYNLIPHQTVLNNVRLALTLSGISKKESIRRAKNVLREVGILRAIGASKRNISSIFNAETFIIGLLSGLIGVGFSYLVIPLINLVLHHFTGDIPLNAALAPTTAVFLVVLSVALTLIAGIIPSRSASKKNPVEALRSE